MTTITPSFIYWITRLDNINVVLMTFALISGCGLIMSIVGLLNTTYAEDKKGILVSRKGLRISAPIFSITILFLTFLPTTKEACAMYIIPKIVNNEGIQNIGKEFYDLALDWMKELHPNKKNKEESK